MNAKPSSKRDPLEFVKSRLLGRYSALWRVMGLLKPLKYHIVFANFLLFFASSLSSIALVSLAPFVNTLFMDRGPEPAAIHQAEKPPEAQEEGERKWSNWFREKAPLLEKAAGAAKERYVRVVTWCKQSQRRFILSFSLFILIILAVAGVLQFGGDIIMATVCISVTSDLLRTAYNNVLRQEMEFFDRSSTGDLINTCYREVFRIRPMVKLLASTRPLLPLKMGILFVALLYLSVELSILLLLLLPVVIVPTMLLTRRLKRSLSLELEGEALPITIMTESFQGIRAVKAFGAEDLECRYLDPAVDDYVAMTQKRRRAESMIGPVVDLLNMSVMLLVLITASLYFGDSLALDAGTLVAFMLAMTRFYKPFRSLMTMNIRMQRSNAVAKRVFRLVDRYPRIQDAPDAVAFPAQWRSLILEDVHLSYIALRRGHERTRKVLRGVNLEIRRGESVAMVGPNGAGKSSIINLICRLYEPSAGVIRVDDTPLNTIRLRDIREKICLITQTPVLFNRTIAENISFGLEGVSDERIVEAARATNCHEFIASLPNGYESLVGEQGRMLSGGERQKIVLARAFVRNPEILILDEPTAGLDQESTAEFLKVVHGLRQRGATTIFITHDRSQLEQFERIFLVTLESGVREIASAAELENQVLE